MEERQTFRIRAAQPRDKRAVRALCARIWSDDYIPELFDEWVRDRRGRFWVAVDHGRIIGIAKLTLIGEREAWLHALRVDPRHRRKGVGTALLSIGSTGHGVSARAWRGWTPRRTTPR